MWKEGQNRPHQPAGRRPITPDKTLDSPAPAASVQRVLAVPAAPSPNDLRTLQRTIGNRAVQRLLAARAPRSSPAAGQSIQRVKIPFYTEGNEQLDTDEPLEIQSFAARMVAAQKEDVVLSIIGHLKGIQGRSGVQNLIMGLKSMLVMARYNRKVKFLQIATKLAEHQQTVFTSVDGFINVYKNYGEQIFSMSIEELFKQVAKASNKVVDTNKLSDYLQKDAANSMAQNLLSARVQQVTIEEFDQLKKNLREVGAQEWDTGQATKGGIFTEEMGPCITLGLTAQDINGKLYSALHHSFSPWAKAATMIESLQQAFGKSGLPPFDTLKNIKYFAVGGDWSSIDKASDILTQLRELNVDVSGITLTTGLEEQDLVKSVIVTAEGEIKYAVFKRSDFKKSSPKKEMFDTGFSSGSKGFGFGGSDFSPGGGGFNFGGGSDFKSGSGGFTSAKNLGETPKDESIPTGGGFTSAKTLTGEKPTGEPIPTGGGFTSAFSLMGRGFTSAKTLTGEKPTDESIPTGGSFTSAKTLLGQQKNDNQDDF